MSLANRCSSQFRSRIRSRGRDYAAENAVALDLLPDAVAAEVYGSSPEPYEISVDWSDQQYGVLRAGCTCPHFADGHLCKHIWATILTVDQSLRDQPLAGPELTVERVDVEGSQFDADDDRPADAAEDDLWEQEHVPRKFQQPEHPALRNRDPQAKSHDWTTPFRQLHRRQFATQLSAPRHASEPANLLAWYVLDVGESTANSQITIDLYCQQRRKDGTYGVLKRLRLQESQIASFNDPADQELLSQLWACASDSGGVDYRYTYHTLGRGLARSTLQVPASMQRFLLPRLAATGRMRWMLHTTQSIEDDGQQITWDDTSAWQFRLSLTADDDAQRWTLCGQFVRGDERLSHDEVVFCIPAASLLLSKTALSRYESDIPAPWIEWLLEHGSIQIPYVDRDRLLKLLWGAPLLPPLDWPQNLACNQVCQPPAPILRVSQPERPGWQRHRKLAAQIAFRYGDHEVAPIDASSGIVEQSEDAASIARVFVRDVVSEEKRIRELYALPTVTANQYDADESTVRLSSRALPDLVTQLMATGWQVEVEGKQFRTAGNFHISVQSGIDWFDLDAAVDFGGVTAQLPDLLKAAKRGDKYIKLSDGSHGLLPEEWLQRYASLADLGDATDGKVRYHQSQVLLLDALLAEQQHLQVDSKFQQFRERLQSFAGISPQEAPRTFQGTLRAYQRDGLGWFSFLHDLGVGGCLADDMGLGKTVQVLALLEAERTRRVKKGAVRKPSLIVVPKSLIFNWLNEASRFTPRLRFVNYTGIGRKELGEQLDDAHVILTTYGTLVRDIVELRERSFNFVILDEAQAIKNANSQAAKASRLLQAHRRLALTGTPIENHLGELWSLFEFLNPGMLGRSRAFAAVCKNVRSNDDGEALGNLARCIAPFVLRRTKKEVLSDLPEKTEQTLCCDLSPSERKAYNELRDFYRAKLAQVIDSKGLQQAKIHVLEALLRLRQAACHPGLIDNSKARGTSAKLDILLEQLDEIIGEGHRALVFSQFTSLLAIVRKQLDKRKIRYEYLDGRTRKRQEVVDRFQQGEGGDVFLISLKAGGQGLNLTEADYVYILDPWWNPAVEMQAIDRAHRIGQKKPVFAYRIIANDTVEQKVLELQESKRELASAIITANDSLIRKLTADDLRLILS